CAPGRRGRRGRWRGAGLRPLGRWGAALARPLVHHPGLARGAPCGFPLPIGFLPCGVTAIDPRSSQRPHTRFLPFRNVTQAYPLLYGWRELFDSFHVNKTIVAYLLPNILNDGVHTLK